MLKWSPLAALFAAALVGCGAAGDKDPVLARVGDATITAEEYRAAYRNLKEADRPSLTDQEAKRGFLQDLVNKQLMELAAAELIPELTPKQQIRLERNARAQREKLCRKLLVDDRVTASAAEKEQVYANLQRDIRLEGILVHDLETGLALRAKLDQGDRFEDVARTYSVREGESGGDAWDLSWRSASDFDLDLVNAVWAAQPGDVVGPERDRQGFWIIRVGESRAVPPEGSLEDMDRALQEVVKRNKSFALQRALQDSLLAAFQPNYPLEGQALLMEVFYWEPPDAYKDDEAFVFTAPRSLPVVEAHQESVIVVEFANHPDWDLGMLVNEMEWVAPGLWPRGQLQSQLIESLDLVVKNYMRRQAASDYGWDQTDEFKDFLKTREQEMKINYLYYNIITDDVEPDQEGIMKWFSENRERYTVPPAYRFAFFSSADRDLMAELRDRWREGASFGELRDEFESRADDLQYIGDSSWASEGQDPGIDGHVGPLRIGGVGDLFMRQDRAYVVRLLDRRDSRLASYEEAKEYVDKDAHTAAREAALVSFLEKQKENYPVEVMEAALARITLNGAQIAE